MSLTDDWKARKLKAGAYYVRLSNGRVDVAKLSKFNRFYAISYTFEVVEVLSPCDYDLFVELTEKVKELEKEVAKGVEIIGKLLNEGHAAIEKNKQFSSLLKDGAGAEVRQRGLSAGCPGHRCGKSDCTEFHGESGMTSDLHKQIKDYEDGGCCCSSF